MSTDERLVQLRTLAKLYPNPTAVLAELANLESILTLPKPTVHVVSDVHGEHDKLRPVIASASGSLRPLAEKLLGDADLLPFIYHPRDTYLAAIANLDDNARRAALQRFVHLARVVIRELAK